MEAKEKKNFKVPHILWIMLGLVVLVSIATYIIPAGQYALDEEGAIISDGFKYLGKQTPVNLWNAALHLLDGFVQASNLIVVVLVSSGMTVVVLGTGAIDSLINWCIYKLKDKDQNILVIMMFCLMTYIGAFAGSDALIALVPVGVMFAKKLKLDLICGLLFSTFATFIGMGVSPVKHLITQMLLELRLYGAFGTLFIIMNIYMLVGLWMTLSYVNKIRKDPTKSPLYSLGWRPDSEISEATDQGVLKDVKLTTKEILVLIIYFAHFGLIIAYPFIGSANIYNFLAALYLIVAIICGVIGGYSMDDLAKKFAKGMSDVAFVTFLIGVARVITIVMTEGNIIHTIVYSLTKPLELLPDSLTVIGMSAAVSLVDLIITSVVSKSTLMVPIFAPIAETLGIYEFLVLFAFQLGDSFTKLMTPFAATIVASCALAGVPFGKWVKWVLPKVLIFIGMAWVILFVLTITGWTAF